MVPADQMLVTELVVLKPTLADGQISKLLVEHRHCGRRVCHKRLQQLAAVFQRSLRSLARDEFLLQSLIDGRQLSRPFTDAPF